ncbi:unknown [Coprococcus comes CAG:19]|nr:unknown [Coprococcus comes CAG:19]
MSVISMKQLLEAGVHKTNGGKKHERYFNETTFRSRCSFWTSDKKMEP